MQGFTLGGAGRRRGQETLSSASPTAKYTTGYRWSSPASSRMRRRPLCPGTRVAQHLVELVMLERGSTVVVADSDGESGVRSG